MILKYTVIIHLSPHNPHKCALILWYRRLCRNVYYWYRLGASQSITCNDCTFSILSLVCEALIRTPVFTRQHVQSLLMNSLPCFSWIEKPLQNSFPLPLLSLLSQQRDLCARCALGWKDVTQATIDVLNRKEPPEINLLCGEKKRSVFVLALPCLSVFCKPADRKLFEWDYLRKPLSICHDAICATVWFGLWERNARCWQPVYILMGWKVQFKSIAALDWKSVNNMITLKWCFVLNV